ncbi:hypothetical protein C9374_001470 [Naegleria lovaniensis]|uniref:Uncharacterized protein n=1 Tax=Naegleria lovaniensis TaxID=51637 RepID=A0AA88GXR3_NAELO|nr:uncharacterized protein C9374_001470 [Naegleria lovaniensis]KAG2387876.1 hypothetical protein C9374_001470 [Naegleria lovaniensis]
MNEWSASSSEHDETQPHIPENVSNNLGAMTKTLELSKPSTSHSLDLKVQNNSNNFLTNNPPNDLDEDESGRVMERTKYSKLFSWMYFYFGKFRRSPSEMRAWFLRAAKLIAVFLFSQIISALLTSTGIFSTFLTDRVHVNLPTLQNALSYLTLLIFYMPLLLVHKVCYPTVTITTRKFRKMRRKTLTTSCEHSKERMTMGGHVTLHESSHHDNILNGNDSSSYEMSQKRLTEQSRLLSPVSSFAQLDSINSSSGQNEEVPSSSTHLNTEHSQLHPSFSHNIQSELNLNTSQATFTSQQVHHQKNYSQKVSQLVHDPTLEENPICDNDYQHDEEELHHCLFKYVKRCFTFTRWNMKPWKYFFFALADVEANFFVVKAYQYTTITSVMLLDCFTIPCVMILSALFLNRSYRWTHIVGVLICLGGLALLVLSDYLSHIEKQQDENSSNDRPWYHVLIGDAFCIIGSACYAISNVAQEYAVKTEEHFTELVEKEEEEHSEETSPPLTTATTIATGASITSNNEGSSPNDDIQQQQEANNLTKVFHVQDVVVNDSQKKPLKKIKLTENDCVIEYLAMMGLFGTFIATIQLLIFELQDIKNTDWNSRSVFFMGGFAASMFLIYTLSFRVFSYLDKLLISFTILPTLLLPLV